MSWTTSTRSSILEMISFNNGIAHDSVSHLHRQRYCRQLESWLCQIPSLKQYRLYIYGSSGNGFGNISCDVDLTFCYTYTDTSSTQPSTPVKEQSEPSKTTNTTEQTTPENKESTSAPKSPVDTASMTIADCCDEVVEVLQKHGMTNIDTSRLYALVRASHSVGRLGYPSCVSMIPTTRCPSIWASTINFPSATLSC